MFLDKNTEDYFFHHFKNNELLIKPKSETIFRESCALLSRYCSETLGEFQIQDDEFVLCVKSGLIMACLKLHNGDIIDGYVNSPLGEYKGKSIEQNLLDSGFSLNNYKE